MDEEVITWNLRGPKRMKKRKELNALIKNNVKYKSLSKKNSADAFNMSTSIGTSGGTGRLLNYTSSEDQEYFFTANKTTIRERRRYYCRMFKLFFIGLFVTISLLFAFSMIFSYSKFQNLLNNLKNQVDLQNSNTQKDINAFKIKMDEYEGLFKKIKEKITNNEDFSKDVREERAQFGNPIEFILTVIGYAVGLGNVWRFPFLVFKHGGAPFLIPFFLMLFLVGIPTFFLETSIGQFSGLSPSHAFEKMVPIAQGLGYAAIIINAFIGFYYNIIIAYCLYYLVFSIRSELPWADCNGQFDCFKRQNLSGDCKTELYPFTSKNITIRSPSEVYFYDKVLEISDGIQNLDGLVLHLVLALILAWFFVYAALAKGVQSLGKISYFTSTFPYVMLTILVVRGALLDGANEGLKFYVGSFDASKLGDPELWKDATVQVFYALSACSGGLISMSSFNAFNNNLFRDSLLVPILDCLTGFYAGFAIFTVLGHMYITKCVSSFNEVAAQGPELAFVVYPEGLSLMGSAAPFFSFLFFIMMLALGFGSEFSIMESVMSTAVDIFKKQINTRAKNLGARLIIVIVYFLCALTMVTRGGLYVLNLIDTVIAGYPLLVVGLLQVIVVPWIYGTDRLVNDIEHMIGKKPRAFWMIWIISWKFITPIILFAIIVASIIMPSDPISLNGRPYPSYAVAIGWVIVAIPISAIPICAIYQFILKHKDGKNYRKLFEPSVDYYATKERFFKKQEEIKKNEIKPFENNARNEISLTSLRKNVVSPSESKV